PIGHAVADGVRIGVGSGFDLGEYGQTGRGHPQPRLAQQVVVGGRHVLMEPCFLEQFKKTILSRKGEAGHACRLPLERPGPAAEETGRGRRGTGSHRHDVSPTSDGLLCSDFPRDRRVMHPEAVAWAYLMSPLAT